MLSPALFATFSAQARRAGYAAGLKGTGLTAGGRYDYRLLKGLIKGFAISRPAQTTAMDRAGLHDPWMDGWHDGVAAYVEANKTFGPADWARAS